VTLPMTCVHDDGREHPSDGTLPCPLVAAVDDTYTEEGQALWWKAWDRADENRRRHMERMVMSDGNAS
jgi:hypothetical protein